MGYAPSELLMGRMLKSNVPISDRQLLPSTPNRNHVKLQDEKLKKRQVRNFDSRHATKDLPALSSGNVVWVSDRQAQGKVITGLNARSYEVDTSNGSFRRNRRDLISTPHVGLEEPLPELSQTNAQPQSECTQETTTVRPPSPRQTRSKTGKSAPPPDRYDPSGK